MSLGAALAIAILVVTLCPSNSLSIPARRMLRMRSSSIKQDFPRLFHVLSAQDPHRGGLAGAEGRTTVSLAPMMEYTDVVSLRFHVRLR